MPESGGRPAGRAGKAQSHVKGCLGFILKATGTHSKALSSEMITFVFQKGRTGFWKHKENGFGGKMERKEAS